MGEALSVTENLDRVLSGGSVFLDLKTPLAIIPPSMKDNTQNYKQVKDYSLFWRHGLDYSDGQIVLSQGVFSLPDIYLSTTYAKSILLKIKNYLSNNGFAVDLTEDGNNLSFHSDHLGRALFIEKFPHHGNTIFSIFDVLDTSKYLSVFHGSKGDSVVSNIAEKSKTILKDEDDSPVNVENQPDHTIIQFF